MAALAGVFRPPKQLGVRTLLINNQSRRGQFTVTKHDTADSILKSACISLGAPVGTSVLLYSTPEPLEALETAASDVNSADQVIIDTAGASLISIEAFAGSIGEYFEAGDPDLLVISMGSDGLGQLLLSIPDIKSGRQKAQAWHSMANQALIDNCIRDRAGAPINGGYDIPDHPGEGWGCINTCQTHVAKLIYMLVTGETHVNLWQ
jgi:hypothetical protein